MDHEELKKRRRAREAQRRKRQQAQRQMLLRLAIAVVLLIVSGTAIFLISQKDAPENPGDSLMATETAPVETAQPTEEPPSWEKEDTVIRIAAAGDLNVTDTTVWAGSQQGGSYDFTQTFVDVAAILSDADLAMVNFEGIACGMPYGSVKNSAPQEMLIALKNAGVDVVQAANSCSINNGVSGLATSLANIRSAGLEPVGAFANAEEFQRSKGYTIVNVGDVKIALVAFTKGMNSRGLPTGSENCVNLLYTDYSTEYRVVDEERIKKILQAAQVENPDLTIAMLHWGSELNDTISKSQETIQKLMLENGVDVILGTHPHMVHKVDYDDMTGQLIAYSLGDFLGDASRSGTQYSIILELEITKNHNEGFTRVTDYSYTPIYTLTEDDSAGGHRVVRIENAMAAYEANYIDKVTDACYADMEYSLKRIRERLNGE